MRVSTPSWDSSGKRELCSLLNSSSENEIGVFYLYRIMKFAGNKITSKC